MKKTKRWLTVLLCLGLLAGLCAACTVPEPADSSVDSGEILPRELTAAEKETVQAYLNAAENNGLVGCQYATPQDVPLNWMFYDGAGVGDWDMSAWSEEEKQALLAHTGWEEFYVKVMKLPAAAVAATVEEKLGIPLSAVSRGLSYHYLEEYDTYYSMHSDTNMVRVTVTGGRVAGQEYTVQYTAEYIADSEEAFTVVLRRTADGYQFVSNLPDEPS